MRIRHAVLAGALAFPAVPLIAQRAEIPRPDTLGANFDHTVQGKGTPADYDFLVGTWKFRYQARDPASGNYSPPTVGEWTGKKPFGTLFFDEFVRMTPNGANPPIMTYRVFNPTKSDWEVQGVALQRGVWQPGVSWSDGKDRFLVQENPERKTLVRIRYYSIEPNHFLWRADGSSDGGKTWMRDVMLIEATCTGQP
jgi:hypothetical protein